MKGCTGNFCKGFRYDIIKYIYLTCLLLEEERGIGINDDHKIKFFFTLEKN